MSWYQKAAARLDEKTGKLDRYAAAMKGLVQNELLEFCRQDEEFAQAVAQGKSFAECMTAVGKKAQGKGWLSDQEAYLAAVQFYFPGAEIRCTMTIDLAGQAGLRDEGRKPSICLDLSDFL